MQKRQKYHHSITENGNLQLRIVTEYIEGDEVIEKKYSDPMTPADVTNLDGWDMKSVDLVTAVTDKKVSAYFKAEKQEPTGIGVEKIETFDRVIDEDGRIAVRKIIRVYDDGVEVSKKYHRSWIMPGDDASKSDVISTAIAKKLHTPEVISAYKEKKQQEKISEHIS